jgi:hypothetical protein
MGKKLRLPRKLKKIMDKINYQTGLGGAGEPSLFDVNRHGALTWRELKKYKKDFEEFKTVKRDIFRKACIKVLGEDPETDWE